MTNYLFFDIDGTLLDNGGRPSKSTVDALHRAQAMGNRILINTGRTAGNVDGFLRDIGFDGYIYGCGTQIEWQGEQLFYRTQTPQMSREIVELVRRCHVAVLYECADGLYTDPSTRTMPWLKDLLDLYERKKTPFQPIPEDPQWHFDKFCIWQDADSDYEGFLAGIEGKFEHYDRESGFVEMSPIGCTKATGMEFLMKHLGIDRAQTYAFGDSLNDAAMLICAGTAVAMENGRLLHPYADYITASVSQNGIEQALRHFNLI